MNLLFLLNFRFRHTRIGFIFKNWILFEHFNLERRIQFTCFLKIGYSFHFIAQKEITIAQLVIKFSTIEVLQAYFYTFNRFRIIAYSNQDLTQSQPIVEIIWL